MFEREREQVFQSKRVLANGYGSEELGSVVTYAGAAGIHNSATVGTYLPCAEHQRTTHARYVHISHRDNPSHPPPARPHASTIEVAVDPDCEIDDSTSAQCHDFCSKTRPRRVCTISQKCDVFMTSSQKTRSLVLFVPDGRDPNLLLGRILSDSQHSREYKCK